MGSLYNLSLLIHSWNRWLILLAGILLIVMVIGALNDMLHNMKNINKVALSFIVFLHIQLLVGLLLYFFISPLTEAALSDFASAMKNPELRFWAVEHSFLNLAGIILAQIGYSKAKRRTDDRSKQKTLLIWTSIALFLIILVIPIGIMGVERPWFRF